MTDDEYRPDDHTPQSNDALNASDDDTAADILHFNTPLGAASDEQLLTELRKRCNSMACALFWSKEEEVEYSVGGNFFTVVGLATSLCDWLRDCDGFEEEGTDYDDEEEKEDW